MTKAVISHRAQADMHDIWSYIDEDSRQAADKCIRGFEHSYQMLAQHPRLGPSRPDLRKGLRYFPTDSYLILYREIENGVEIVRVLHGARNLEAIFHGDD